MSSENLDAVLAPLNRHRTKPVIMVAIDGHSAAGKSTLASIIEQTVPNVTVIHMDDFYRPLDAEERANLDARGGYERYYDWERLEEQVLKPLSHGQESRYQKYDWSTNDLGGWTSIQPTGMILIEGCYAARPELRAYYDKIILVETAAHKRLARQYERADATAAWLARWDAAERYYMKQHRPQMYADLVITGE